MKSQQTSELDHDSRSPSPETLKRRNILLESLFPLAALCLFLGLYLPIIKTSWLFLVDSHHSVLSTIQVLYDNAEYILAAVLLTFSVLFPVAKLLYLLGAYLRFIRGKLPEKLDYLHWLGKWSMLDVLLLAIVVAYVKQSGLADAETRPALYFFSISVILTIIMNTLFEKMVKQELEQEQSSKPEA